MRTLVKIILFLGINAIVQALWVSMELAVYGAPRPSTIDTVISLVLSASLYLNLMRYVYIAGQKENRPG